ncbi:hypothetical protein ACX80D_07160 [Arthrobacter sp. Sr24]
MTSHESPPAAASQESLLAPGSLFIFSELSAMAMDGVLCHVFGQVFRPSALAETAAMRAAALAHYIPAFLSHRAVLAQLSAAWVYGCAPLPAEVALLVDNDGNSAAVPRHSGCTVSQVHLEPQDIQLVGTTAVTTVLRTALDVARSAPLALARPALEAMARDASLACPLESIQQALLDAPHIPGKLRAQELVQALLDSS